MLLVNEKAVLNQPQEAGKYLLRVLKRKFDKLDWMKEHFIVIGMRNSNQVEFVEIVHIGTGTTTVVAPADVYRRVIIEGCPKAIVAHNHPSGNVEASPQDIETTERLINAGKIIGIDMLDHIILTKSTFASLRETTLLWD